MFKAAGLKGLGVFATKAFAKGEFICEYAGELIEYKTAQKRYDCIQFSCFYIYMHLCPYVSF